MGSCIAAVIDQGYPNIEHIIVDGQSTDDTVAIIKSYAERHSHIRWISEPDRGQSDAMNKGIAMASGEILGILNVDDFYEPNVLNRVAQIFKGLSEPSLVVGNCNVWDHNGDLLYINRPCKLQLSDLLKGFRVNQSPVNPSAYFYHTSLHQTLGLYRVGDDYAMDLDFLLRAVQLAKVYYVNETWGNYRMLEGTKTVRDKRGGLATQRVQHIYRMYRRRLPALQRLYVGTVYAYHYGRKWQKVRYSTQKCISFLRRPKRLFPLSKQRFIKR